MITEPWTPVIEQIHADLKHSALTHLPSGVFTANAASLVWTLVDSSVGLSVDGADASAVDPRWTVGSARGRSVGL